VFPVTRPHWPDHGFDETSVAAVSESVDDFTIAVNVDNLHLSRLIESVSYRQVRPSIPTFSNSTSYENSIASRKRSSPRSQQLSASMRRRYSISMRRVPAG
jgi:hypothetical protein